MDLATSKARSSISPTTATSATMTALPPPAVNGHSSRPTKGASQSSNVNACEALVASLQPGNRFSFLEPAAELSAVAVTYAKNLLDGFAAKIYEDQKSRVEAEKRGKKRKRSSDAGQAKQVLKIRKIVTEGFATTYVWSQTSRVIDALKTEVERDFEGLKVQEEEVDQSGFDTEEDEFAFGIGEREESGDVDMEREEEVSDDEQLDEEEMAALDEIEAGSGMDEIDEREYLEDDDQNDEDEDHPTDVYVQDAHGLNDGFFSIDEFNKQTEFLEQQDALADPYTGEASDEEDVDWEADPVATAKPTTSSSRRKQAMDIDLKEAEAEKSDDDEEDGPTFGNADLNAPFSDDDDDNEAESEADMDGVPTATDNNTNDVLYADFFEPPARKASKGERQTAYLARQANKKSKTATEEEREADFEIELERAQASQRRDLFEDESEPSDSEAEGLDPGDPKSRKSAHERRQAKLAAEIRKLEAASVEKREWTLQGEAKASDREKNSLTFLEEELDFERTGKPVPVITAEVSESIEDLIKDRILKRQFDEVIKRRPDSLTLSGEKVRRGAIEFSDEKSAKGLGELYAEDHVKATAEAEGATYVSASDEKLNKQREEVKALWRDLEGKLDALSSWHYRPRPVAPAITVVSDISTVRMEDAQPSTANGIAGASSMLAPQEIYKAGQDLNSASVGEDGEEEKNRDIIRGGVPVARVEMTRDEKVRRRRREKERIRKSAGQEEVKGGKGAKRVEGRRSREKKEVLGQLKRGGVMVVNRKGEVRDMDGNKAVKKGRVSGGGGFKL